MNAKQLAKAPSYVVIIRATWERGQAQADAMAELARRGLWLSEDQRRQAAARLTA